MGHSNTSSSGRRGLSPAALLEAAREYKRINKIPLSVHRARRWVRKIRGEVVYFGSVDPGKADFGAGAALDRHHYYMEHGCLPDDERPDDRATVADICDQFRKYKDRALEAGEIAPRTYDTYVEACDLLVDHFGKQRVVETLRPADFGLLRAKMAKRWGTIALGPRIQTVRSVFRYAYDAELTDKPARFGPEFKKPPARAVRKSRAKHGPKLFTPEQVKALLDAASPNIKAMILLGINGGMGNTDAASLPMTAVDLEAGWVDFPREKTAVPRKFPLWKETADAIRKALESRPKPKDKADTDLVFIRLRGKSYLGGHRGHAVSRAFSDLRDATGIDTRRQFYDFRRTFQTIGEQCGDVVAVRSIMGHAPASGDMSSIYRQEVSDERLRRVVEHVRTWVYGSQTESE